MLSGTKMLLDWRISLPIFSSIRRGSSVLGHPSARNFKNPRDGLPALHSSVGGSLALARPAILIGRQGRGSG